MGAQTSHIISDNISETSLSSALSGLTYQSCSETSYADTLSTSISEREIVSTPNLEGFSFNDLTNAIRSFRFDSLLGQEGFGSSARSSLIARSSSETSYAESYSTSIFEGEILSAPEPKAFQLIELKNATSNFSPNLVLDQGEFGYLFEGWIDEQTLAATKPGSKMVVAIKKLEPEGFPDLKEQEWLTKVNYLGQLHHPNLVKLIGYCSDGHNRLLVYEFMPKGSLKNHLFGRGFQPLSWEMRIKVAIGAARGLFFLHEAKIIHGNFKASNILLDAEFSVKLSDFISKAHEHDTDICNEYCYLRDPPGGCAHLHFRHLVIAPEFVATGMLTAKGDVYSFGVVLLELLTGLRANGQHNLVEWAKPFLGNRRKLLQIMDTELEGQYPQKGAYMAATLALKCLSAKAEVRPQMADVLATLEQLEAPKIAAKHSPYEQQTISSPVQKSPLRQRHSPMNLTPSASPLPVPLPLPPHGRSTHVHRIKRRFISLGIDTNKNP